MLQHAYQVRRDPSKRDPPARFLGRGSLASVDWRFLQQLVLPRLLMDHHAQAACDLEAAILR
jgi:hypothetical protein